MCFISGPASRQSSPGLTDDLPEEEDDVEVDVEECSDSESPSAPKLSEDCGSDRDSPSSPAPQPCKVAVRCNCEELLSTECHLETKELWDKFHDLGTEMIITKTGR